ncbi:unnamed protein product, partial [Effrenium voratum]
VQDEKSLCISKVLYEPINREAIEELAETRELKKLEMQDQDNSDAIDKLLERIGMFPNLPT